MRLKQECKPVLTIKEGVYSVKQPEYIPLRIHSDCKMPAFC